MDNNFIESLKPKTKTRKHNISSELRSEIITILKREKTIKEVCDSHKGDKNFPQDPKGIKRLIVKLAERDEEIKELYRLYMEYKQDKNCRKRNHYYYPEILYMLKNDLSQRKTAGILKIPRDTFKSAISRIRRS